MGESLGVHDECGIHDTLALILAESCAAKVDVGRRHHGEGGMMMMVVVVVVVVQLDKNMHPGCAGYQSSSMDLFFIKHILKNVHKVLAKESKL